MFSTPDVANFMQYRRFGKTQLSVSELGFGCARIGGVFHDSSRSELLKLLRGAADAGITFFDTADMYAQGDSERLVGEAFCRDRQRVVIATKFGYVLPKQKQLGSQLKPLLKPVVTRLGLSRRHIPSTLRGTVGRQDFSPEYIVRSIDASLRRLRTDYIDVYQLHSPSIEVLRRAEFVEPLERCREKGKIRYWGVACEYADDVLDCLPLAPLASVQVGFNVLEQNALDWAIPEAAARGIGIIDRQVYASGLLTRPVQSFCQHDLDVDPVVAENKRTQITSFASIAEHAGRSRAELALKFALAQPGLSVVLLGISRQSHLDSALEALHAPNLSAHEHMLVHALATRGKPTGGANSQ
ncbi:MAG: aldo/keto reductase [Chloroflexi bacterium]|nr:aldo/keto reductase [Chloroflexota bacterium]